MAPSLTHAHQPTDAAHASSLLQLTTYTSPAYKSACGTHRRTSHVRAGRRTRRTHHTKHTVHILHTSSLSLSFLQVYGLGACCMLHFDMCISIAVRCNPNVQFCTFELGGSVRHPKTLDWDFAATSRFPKTRPVYCVRESTCTARRII